MATIMKCPKCAEEMEEELVFLSSPGSSFLCWSKETPTFWHIPKEREILLRLMVRYSEENVRKAYKCPKCHMVCFEYPAVKEPKVELPDKPKTLYEQLLYKYANFYGGGRLVLESKIKSLVKQGLSREEAIRKLAEKEKLIEKE